MNVGYRIPTEVKTEPSEFKIDLRQYLNFIWRNSIFIVSVTALALLPSVVYLVRATPRYTASTQLLLEQAQKAPGLDASSAAIDNYTHIENQIAILRSDALLRRVAIKEFTPPSTKDSQVPAQNEEDQASREKAIPGQINDLRGALTVSRSGVSPLLNISITWDNPARAEQLANAVADALIVDQLDARLESAKRASVWLSDRLTDLRRQLSDSERAVEKFRKEHGLTRGGATVALNDAQIADLNNKLVTARTEAAEKKARVKFLEDLAAGKNTLDSVPESFLSGSLLGALRSKLSEVSQRRADLLARYSSNYPAVVNLEAEKRDVERSIAAETQRVEQTVKNEYTLAQARLDAIEQTMRQASGQGELNNDDAVRLRELERTAAVNKTLFEEFLAKAKITDEQATFRARDVRVIMPAQSGGKTFPNTAKTLLTALIAGLGLGIGGALAMEMLKTGFASPREVEDTLGVPVLASVGKLSKNQLVKDGKSIPLESYQIHYPLSPFSEAIRTLRTGIHMSDVDQPPKVVHVMSARPGEGKTFTAVNLAISAASAGLKTVLVDADLRHPAASRTFRLEKERGLVDVLMGSTPVDNVLRFYKDLNLMVIPAGSKSLNPPDLLGSERMKMLISRLKETFDYVVLDTPPVGPVVDPVIVANLADKTIFVVQWSATPRELVEASIRQVGTHKRLAGIVFNLVNENRARKYGGEYYYQKSYEKYYSA